ncbi:putative dicer-like protein [Podospora australis]|uniref:Dicer-like protein 1 n=1 Tax=Podospora australis TaxID=1536484 RepID=A0AAN6X841_9PEZI|nr:putative dicer-like protein [Podospora australis]
MPIDMLLASDDIPPEGPYAVGDLDEDQDSDPEDSRSETKQLEVNEPPKPRKISERRRADNLNFDLWIEENQHELSKGTGKIVLDNDKSISTLVRDFENKRIIASPRDYQLELFELAKTQNTIAVLDTGSGKTLIAALLLRWTIQNELEDRSRGLPKRTAFFLVDKVALVFQQHAVLTCNLDYPVEKFCGEMVDEVSSVDFWKSVFDNNMAIVCTSEILYQCLHHSYISMDQINLLIFDEAHHTKKNHPYARIIKDFYMDTQRDRRPRILGMTASPVDAHVDPKIAAAELEGLLHSQIATVSDPTALQNSTSKPKKEAIIEYDVIRKSGATQLDKALKDLVGGHKHFNKAFAFTEAAYSELGPWCVDRYWQLFFQQDDIAKLEVKAERTVIRHMAFSQAMGLDKNSVRDAHALVHNHEFQKPSLDLALLSPKVVALYNLLKQQFSGEDSNRRCIVFVKQRNTASMLRDLLQQPDMKIPGLEAGVLTGNGRNDSSWDSSKTSYRDQVLTIIKFKKGELNCIFATSVAEEGLDIPDCNVIIRFDLYDTLIQYIQSRGRARQQDSIYYHMTERGNFSHKSRVHQLKHNEDALRRFCEALPENRKLTGNNYNMDYFLRKEKGQKQYTVPETGAKLNYKQSLICLANFTSSLPHPPESTLTPTYVLTTVPGGFQCEVQLPSSSPVQGAIGSVHGSKAVAKCSAAFETCLLLFQGKYLDSHLRPVFTKQLPAMRNARLAISSKKKEEYGMRLKPEIWSALGGPTELSVMALVLENPEALGRPSSPLLLLTRVPMPKAASFPLYYGAGRKSNVHCHPVPGHFRPTKEQVDGLVAFTLTVFRDVFSKQYKGAPEQFPYFLAPSAHKEHTFAFASADPTSVVDWDIVKFVRENDCIRYGPDEFNQVDSFFTNKYVRDPYDGSRKFFLRGRRRDLKPTDPVPEGVVPPNHRAWRTTCKEHDILNYSNSMWSKARSKVLYKEDQPVVEAEVLPIRRNLLDDDVGDAADMTPKKCFIVLEPLKISSLPVDFVAMVYNFPAIAHRIDSNLVALDACKVLGLDIRPDLALEAFTKDSDNTDEHDVEQVNFQRGMGNNYERLEFLGDAFLKMATTIAIFTLIPEKAEFEYHVERMLLICNKNLFNNALDVKLEEYIRSMAFNRRTWYPEGLELVAGKFRDNIRRKHVLADKSIADVCEAIIGAAYLTCQEKDPQDFDLAIQAVTKMVKSKNHRMKTWSDYYAAYTPPSWQIAPTTIPQEDMAEKFHTRLGYKFTHPRLLRSAFQHSTYPSVWEKLPSYERLEFLGDALLDMVCIDYLFHRFPGADPQWLTEHKMAMVSNQFLGCLGVFLVFHKNINMLSSAVQSDMTTYVAEIETALSDARAKAVSEGKTENDWSRDFWVHCSRPPKSLPDVVEAYVGAMFVDSQYDFSVVRELFDKYIRPFFEDMALYDTFANKHPVTFLTSLMQNKFHCTEYRLLVREIVVEDNLECGILGEKQVVCAVRVHGQTLAHAVSQSSRYAKIGAAKKALKILEEMEVTDFRKGYGCACTCLLGDIEGDMKGQVDGGVI